MSEPTDTDPDPDGPDPGQPDPRLYDVTGAPDDLPQLAAVMLPRRPAQGSRGTLVCDRPAGVVHLLDADDTAGTFRYRESRPLAGDPADMNPPRDGSDHIVRAALESAFDVIAAPWAGDDGDDGDDAVRLDSDAPTRRQRPRAARRRTGGDR